MLFFAVLEKRRGIVFPVVQSTRDIARSDKTTFDWNMLRKKKTRKVVPLSSDDSSTISNESHLDGASNEEDAKHVEQEPLLQNQSNMFEHEPKESWVGSSFDRSHKEGHGVRKSLVLDYVSDVGQHDETEDRETDEESDEEVELFPILPYEKWDTDRNNWNNALERIQQKILDHRASKHLVDFDDDLPNQAVTICSIDQHDLDESRYVAQERVQQEVEMKEMAHQKIMNNVLAADERIDKQLRRKRQEYGDRTKEAIKQMKIRNKKYRSDLSSSFWQMEKEMKLEMKRRKNVISSNYGSFNHLYNTTFLCTALSRCYWNTLKRHEVEISLKCIRGLKDKLPKAKYAIVVSIRDGIAGREVVGGIDQSLFTRIANRMSNRVSERYFSMFDHDGSHRSFEVSFESEQKITLLLPAKYNMKPHYVYSFEMIKLSGENVGTCVCWGVFPIETPEFKVIDGACKTPLIRGWMDSNVDQYHKIQGLCCESLDNWMGNLYFKINSRKVTHPSESYELLEENHNQILWEDYPIQSSTTTENREPSLTETDIEAGQIIQPQHGEWDRYKFEVKNSYKASVVHQALGRVRFVTQSIMTEMGYLSPISVQFVVAMLMILCAFWMRIYVHYFGQWCMLKFFKTPDIQYVPTWIRVAVGYEANYLSLTAESMVVIAGAMMNILVLLFMIAMASFFQQLRISVPFFASKYVFTYGCMVLLDPILILIVDCCFKDWKNGDSFRIYRKLADEKSDSPNSPIWGIFIVIVMHLWTIMISTIVMHFFSFRVFLNGTILDVYRRLYGRSNDFHVPNDQEVSQLEFDYIIGKSLRYRSAKGEFRRVVAVEYSTVNVDDTEPSEPNNDRLIHIFLLTIPETKTSYSLHRHFIWKNDGTLEELFDSTIPPETRRMIDAEQSPSVRVPDP